MPHRSFSVIVLLLITGLGLVSAACNGDDGRNESPTATREGTAEPTTPAGETPAATEPEPTDGPFQGARDPVEGTLGNLPDMAPPVATLVDVRVGEHADFDRIVFEFTDVGTVYTVGYADAPVGCGSGEPVELEGEAFLQIKLIPAQAHNDAGETTIDALELTPGYPAIAAAVQSCDFEADVTWVVGLPAQLDFRVTEVGNPPRLAVDVGHP